MSLRLKISSLCEPIDANQIKTLFTIAEQAARTLVLMVPAARRDIFLQEVPIVPNGVQVLFLQDVIVSGVLARQASQAERRLRETRNSIYRSVSFDPVFYRDGDLVIVPGLQVGTSAYAYAIPNPTFPAYNDDNTYEAITEFPDLPSEVQTMTNTLAASYWMVYRAGLANQSVSAIITGSAADLASFLSTMPTYSAPSAPTLSDLSLLALDTSAIAFTKTALASLATYTPETPPTLTALDLTGINEPAAPSLPALDLTGLEAPAAFTPATLDLTGIDAPTEPTLPTLDMTGLPEVEAPTLPTLDLTGLVAPTSPTLGDLDLSSYVKPTKGTITKPTIPDVAYSAPDEPDPWPSVTAGTAPTWDDPGSPPDISSNLVTIGELMTRFDDFIGKIITPATDPAVSTTTANPSGAFWLKDEDEEMVMAAVQLAQISLQGAKAYYDNTASLARIYEASVGASSSKLQSEVALFRAEIEAQVAQLQGVIQQYQAQLQGAKDALESTALAARTKLEEYRADGEIVLGTFSAELQGWQTEMRTHLEAWATEVRTLVDKYSAEVQAYNVAVRSRIDPYQVTSQVLLEIYRTDAQVLQTIVSTRLEPYAIQSRSLIDVYSAQIQGYLASIRAKIDPYQVSENVKLGIYQTEAQVYATLLRAKVDPYVAETQALVSAYQGEVQAFSTLISARIQPWATENQIALQRYQTVVEAGLSEWRTRVETALREFETTNSVDLQATRIEVERMTSEFQLNLQAKVSNNQNLLEQYRVDAEVASIDFQSNMAKARGYLEKVQVATDQAQIGIAQVRSALEMSFTLRSRFFEDFRAWASEGASLFMSQGESNDRQ